MLSLDRSVFAVCNSIQNKVNQIALIRAFVFLNDGVKSAI